MIGVGDMSRLERAIAKFNGLCDWYDAWLLGDVRSELIADVLDRTESDLHVLWDAAKAWQEQVVGGTRILWCQTHNCGFIEDAPDPDICWVWELLVSEEPCRIVPKLLVDTEGET